MWCHRPVVCCYLQRRWGLLHCREKSHQPSWSCVQVFAVEICSIFLRGFNAFYSTEWKHLCSPTSAVPSILLSFKWCLMLRKSEDYFSLGSSQEKRTNNRIFQGSSLSKTWTKTYLGELNKPSDEYETPTTSCHIVIITLRVSESSPCSLNEGWLVNCEARHVKNNHLIALCKKSV